MQPDGCAARRCFAFGETCAHTPCGRVIASSLRLSHAAAALELLNVLELLKIFISL